MNSLHMLKQAFVCVWLKTKGKSPAPLGVILCWAWNGWRFLVIITSLILFHLNNKACSGHKETFRGQQRDPRKRHHTNVYLITTSSFSLYFDAFLKCNYHFHLIPLFTAQQESRFCLDQWMLDVIGWSNMTRAALVPGENAQMESKYEMNQLQ